MTAFDLIGRPASQTPEPATDLVGCGGPLPPPITAAPTLPAYSGPDAVCPKCLHEGAFTHYQAATTRTTLVERNGTTEYRGPLPEHHQRQCERCDYTWDEDLAIDADGMTVEALAHALHRACPHPVELDRDAREDTARELLQMLRITARPEHPLWQYDDGRPQVFTASAICEEPHPTREDEDACERRRAPRKAAP
ncbi:hypothetical protein ACKI16_29680 [Streptomyces scabiei]|uniref:hypothetical protein n=1 Tax=Streptomyces scabiei TaxID=1930 RepID=UPI0038F79D9C